MYRALVAVDRNEGCRNAINERRSPRTRIVLALGLLDLENVSAELGENLRRGWRRDAGADFDDYEAEKRKRSSQRRGSLRTLIGASPL